jgi:small-conductance mechanosensitive channel
MAQITILVCAIAGYLPLARFLSQQLIVTGSILAFVYLLLLWVDGFAQGLSDDGIGAERATSRMRGPHVRFVPKADIALFQSITSSAP